MATVNSTKEYVTGRGEPGVYHLAVVQPATKHLAAAASPSDAEPPEMPVRLERWRDIVTSNLHYPAQQGEDEEEVERFAHYLRAYTLGASWGSTLIPEGEATVEFMSDTFLSRHGETPSGACERQAGAEVFYRRGTVEYGVRGHRDVGKPWFERAQALLGWSPDEDCQMAYAEIENAVGGELQKIEAAETAEAEAAER